LGIGVAVENGGFVGAFGQAPEAGFFQQGHAGIVGRDEADARDDALDGLIAEQAVDAGAQRGKVHLIIIGSIEAVDADGTGQGEIVGGEIHLNGRMDLHQEEQAVVVKYEVGAKGFFGLHGIVDLPKSFVGIELGVGAIEFMAKQFADDGLIRRLAKGPQKDISFWLR